MDHASRNQGTATEPRTFVVERGGRLDAIVAAEFADLTRARVQRLIDSGSILLEGEVARKSAQAEPGATITVTLPVIAHAAPALSFDLPVLYEDDVLVVVDKPAGLAVHGAPGDTAPSVAGWFIAHYPAEASAFEVERPGIVHRLDKDTTGVLVMAKTPQAQAALSHSFEERATEKTYLAVTDGIPDRPRAVIDAAIARHPSERTKMAVTKNGRESRTGYEVLGSARERAFLLVHPETGRTHQIRVHLSAIRCPVADDSVYGKRRDGGRQLLHAYSIVIPHPSGGRLTVTSPMPSDMAAAVRALGLEAIASSYLLPRPPSLIRDQA